jgi:DNA-binding NtrC family response regulator
MCVLIVEDDETIRDMLSEYLTSCGLPVVVAEDGDAAAELIDNPPRRFSVLVTDFHMPGSRSGCDVAEHMKAHHPHVHLFIMTGRPDVLHAACPQGLPFDVLYKPVPLSSLSERIAPLVEA